MLQNILLVVAFIIWLYLLHVLKRSKLAFWHFAIGAIGLFCMLLIGVVPYLTDPLAKVVASLAGVFGTLTGWFTPYFKYSMIFITTQHNSITMMIDMECSGIIEILAFECILAFFNVYTKEEKVIVAIIGFALITIFNTLRIILICTIVHFFGTNAFGIAHTFVGRIFFYLFTVLLYFYVFTKPQVVRTKVGKLTYGRFKKDY